MKKVFKNGIKKDNHGFILAIIAENNFLEWYSGIPDAYILVLICKVVSRAKIVCVHIVALNLPIIPSSSKRMLKVFMIFVKLKEEYYHSVQPLGARFS